MHRLNFLAIMVVIALMSILIGSSNANGDASQPNNRDFDQLTDSRSSGQNVDTSPVVETDPVRHKGDAADDSAIWVHPTDVALSTVIGTDKQGGLAVYDLDGTQIQFLANGNMNNVDLRYNFPLKGETVTLVTATNRTNDSIAIYQVNPTTRHLENVAARTVKAGFDRIYGLCMYRSPTSGDYHVFVTDKTGAVEQWVLFDGPGSKVDAELVRTFEVGSISEGCVADDELGDLYIAEEDVGIWKYGAEPADGSARTLVDSTDTRGHLTPDVEGLTLYYASGGTGYLIASSQGSSEFAVYQREADNGYLATFEISRGNGIDGVSGTDGIDVTNFPLGPAFPQGVFIAQDDSNVGNNDETQNQNFKLVQWSDIARIKGLSSDTSRDPRGLAVDRPPSIRSVTANEASVQVAFSEPLDPNNAGSYWISNGITISAASLAPDQKTMTLTTSAHTPGADYTLTVAGVTDQMGNVMPLIEVNYRFPLTLSGHWSFDEGAGTIARDVSGNGNDGTLENDTAWVPGKVGSNGVGFGGNNGQVRVTDHDTLNFGVGQDFSISLWFQDSTRGKNVDRSSEILEKQQPGSSGFYQVRSPNSNGDLKIQIDDGSSQDFLFTAAGDLADGQWHHLVMIRDYDVGISAYVDGNPAGSNDIVTAGSLANSADLVFGAGNTSGDSYDGLLDQVRIYRRALSAAEIAQLFADGSGDTAPVITLAGSDPVDVTQFSSYVDAGATAVDFPDGDITGSIVTANQVDTSVLGTYTVTYDVMDSSGNAAVQVTRTVNVVTGAGPVGFWGFDEGTGTTAFDASPNHNDGLLQGAAWIDPGLLGKAVGFGGNNGQVRITDHDTLNFGVGQDFAISLWFRDSSKGTNADNSSEMLEKQEPGSSVFYQVRSPNVNGDLKIQIDDASNQDYFFTSAGDLADGQWHHLVLIRDYDVGISAYVDGNPAGSNDVVTAGSLANSADLLFGGGNTSGDSYDGALDQVRIYRQALSAAEIAALFNSP